MKKLSLILLLFIGVTTAVSAQATRELNFGIIGVGFDIPVAPAIAITPYAGTDFNLEFLNLGVKANYYFDEIFGLPEAFDVYGGANAGFAMWIGNGSESTSGIDIGLQIGGRWFWNEKWGLYLELGGGHHTGGTAGLGLTMRL
jgi:hypothetical protein